MISEQELAEIESGGGFVLQSTLIAEIRRLREALQFYADEKNWLPLQDVEYFTSDGPPYKVTSGKHFISDDGGARAREVLDE